MTWTRFVNPGSVLDSSYMLHLLHVCLAFLNHIKYIQLGYGDFEDEWNTVSGSIVVIQVGSQFVFELMMILYDGFPLFKESGKPHHSRNFHLDTLGMA